MIEKEQLSGGAAAFCVRKNIKFRVYPTKEQTLRGLNAAYKSFFEKAGVVDGHISSVTVNSTPTGKYFVVLNVDFEPEARSNSGRVVGIDAGIKDFYCDSTDFIKPATLVI